MENKIINQQNLINKINTYIKQKKKHILFIMFILIIFTIGIVILNYYNMNQNEKISEKYIKAGIYLSSQNEKKSKEIYKEIILSKNKFYSLLALNNLIENKLEENNDEIIKLFTVVENIKNEKEQINLIKLKKSLFLLKISKTVEANNLLKEIISSNSIWKDAALEVLK